jgi:hypothetical protein
MHNGLLIIVIYFQAEPMIIRAGYMSVQFNVIKRVLSFLPPPRKIERKIKYRASPSTWYMESSSKR